MSVIPFVSNVVDALRATQLELAEIPDRQRADRDALVTALTWLCKGVCLTLNITSVHCMLFSLAIGKFSFLRGKTIAVGDLNRDCRHQGALDLVAQARNTLDRLLNDRDLEISYPLGRQLAQLVYAGPGYRNDNELAEQLGELLREAIAGWRDRPWDQTRQYLGDLDARICKDRDEIHAARHEFEKLFQQPALDEQQRNSSGPVKSSRRARRLAASKVKT